MAEGFMSKEDRAAMRLLSNNKELHANSVYSAFILDAIKHFDSWNFILEPSIESTRFLEDSRMSWDFPNSQRTYTWRLTHERRPPWDGEQYVVNDLCLFLFLANGDHSPIQVVTKLVIVQWASSNLEEVNHQSHTVHILISQNLPCELRTRSVTKTTRSISKEATNPPNKQTESRKKPKKTKTKQAPHRMTPQIVPNVETPKPPWLIHRCMSKFDTSIYQSQTRVPSSHSKFVRARSTLGANSKPTLRAKQQCRLRDSKFWCNAISHDDCAMRRDHGEILGVELEGEH